MRDTTKALYEFYSGFDLPAYVEGLVPDNAELPYITFDAVDSGISSPSLHHVRVWYPGTDNSLPSEKADDIIYAIADGVRLVADTGIVVLYPGTPLVQLQTVDDGTDKYICCAYINLSAISYTVEGA